MSSVAISLIGVRKRFGKVEAVKQVTVDILETPSSLGYFLRLA